MSLPSTPGDERPTSHASSHASGGTNGARYSNGSTPSAGSGQGVHPLVHIRDLQDRATQGLDVNQSITGLITAAENSLRQAVTLLQYRKPDSAYLEYLRTFEILVTYIPGSPRWPDFKAGKGTSYTMYNNVVKVRWKQSTIRGAQSDKHTAPQCSDRTV